MSRCGCGGGCSCILADGGGIVVTGAGSATNPYRAHLAETSLTGPGTVGDGLIGDGTVGSPLEVSLGSATFTGNNGQHLALDSGGRIRSAPEHYTISTDIGSAEASTRKSWANGERLISSTLSLTITNPSATRPMPIMIFNWGRFDAIVYAGADRWEMVGSIESRYDTTSTWDFMGQITQGGHDGGARQWSGSVARAGLLPAGATRTLGIRLTTDWIDGNPDAQLKTQMKLHVIGSTTG